MPQLFIALFSSLLRLASCGFFAGYDHMLHLTYLKKD
jgi:hypothetical protein